MVQRLGRHSQPAVRLLLKQFPVLPELKWETDDARVVGNQQNGGGTHMYTVLDGTLDSKGLNQTITQGCYQLLWSFYPVM